MAEPTPNLTSAIESILFVANKPLTAQYLAKILGAKSEEITGALNEIAAARANSGVVLLEAESQWQFSTNAENSNAVKDFLNAELREKLTDATIETLAIIAYRQPISKAEIEAIRGVNCQYSLRHLSIRGLIHKVPSTKDGRQFLYATTIEFLQHMGLKNLNDLPEFEKMVEKIKLPETEKITEEMPDEQAPSAEISA